MQNKREGDWKHRHSTESSLPGGGLVGAENPAAFSVSIGSSSCWNYTGAIIALLALIKSGALTIKGDPYLEFRGDDLLVLDEDYVEAGSYSGDVSRLRRLSYVVDYLDLSEAEGPGARPVHDRPSIVETGVDVDVPSVKDTSLEKRDWSRPGLRYHDDSDSELSRGLIIGVKIYFVFFLAVLLGFLIYVLSHA